MFKDSQFLLLLEMILDHLQMSVNKACCKRIPASFYILFSFRYECDFTIQWQQQAFLQTKTNEQTKSHRSGNVLAPVGQQVSF